MSTLMKSFFLASHWGTQKLVVNLTGINEVAVVMFKKFPSLTATCGNIYRLNDTMS